MDNPPQEENSERYGEEESNDEEALVDVNLHDDDEATTGGGDQPLDEYEAVDDESEDDDLPPLDEEEPQGDKTVDVEEVIQKAADIKNVYDQHREAPPIPEVVQTPGFQDPLTYESKEPSSPIVTAINPEPTTKPNISQEEEKKSDSDVKFDFCRNKTGSF
eukprot:TRINITY_DN8093_c0_g2_i1.p1 TRINITY_DN8093_c0_g2~~TRINITY_DN8093_c0_g2_i1.p1  ORF type:complete len:189 (+),score=85.40 TRINITY_DN8093_c0_g2_i1:85-567(+)